MSFSNSITESIFAIAYSAHDPSLSGFVKKATLFPIIIHDLIPPPDATIIPEPSKPGVHGIFLLVGYFPFKKAKSLVPIGAASTYIRTSPVYGVGTGISATATYLPKPYILTAFITAGIFSIFFNIKVIKINFDDIYNIIIKVLCLLIYVFMYIYMSYHLT